MMGKIFRDAGFATGYSGKWHINTPPENKEFHGFEWMNNIRENGADVGITPDFATFLEAHGDRPFLFSASFNNPHNICEAANGGPFPDGNPGMIENLDQLPPLPDNFAIPEGEPSVIREVQELFKNKQHPTSNWDEFRWRLHRWYYLRLTELVDRHIGKLLEVLKQSGHWENTLIVFSSDHGDGNAHHQWNQKQSLYDESSRVPFIVVQPGSNLNRIEEKQLVNTGIDLIPTLCGLAGIACPSHLEGQDWIFIGNFYGTTSPGQMIYSRLTRSDLHRPPERRFGAIYSKNGICFGNSPLPTVTHALSSLTMRPPILHSTT